MSIRLKSAAKTPACVSMRAFLQPISARIYFGKTASHRKRVRFVQSRGALPQAYWMSVKAAQRWGCAKRAFCGVCFLMPGGLTGVLFLCTGRRGDVASPPTGDLPHPSVRQGPRAPPRASRIARRDTWVPPYESYCAPFGAEHHRQADVGADDSVRPNSASALSFRASDRVTGVGIRFLRPTARPLP